MSFKGIAITFVVVILGVMTAGWVSAKLAGMTAARR